MSEQQRGSDKVQDTSVIADIRSFLISAKTTITLLFLLAAASVLGTLVPQDAGPGQLEQSFSPFGFRLVVILELHHVFRSWWFVTMMCVLAANLLGCLVHRLPGILALWGPKSRKSAFGWKTSAPRAPEDVKSLISAALRPIMGPRKLETVVRDGVRLVWIKHRFHLLGFPAIHMSIIIILFGALLGLLYGLKGHVLIPEGKFDSAVALTLSGKTWQLPFDIAVDRFTLKRYPTGEPQEFRSDIRLIEKGQEVLKAAVRVNHPVTYRRISLYQSDYQVAAVKAVKLALVTPDGKKQEFTAAPGGTKAQVPGTASRVGLMGLQPGPSGTGMLLRIVVESPGKDAETFRLKQGASDGAKIGDAQLLFLNYEPLYATGLQVTYDPGNKVVYLGFCLLMAGFFLTLFTNHRRVAVEVRASDGGSIVQVFGLSRRTPREFREQIEGVIQTALAGTLTGARQQTISGRERPDYK